MAYIGNAPGQSTQRITTTFTATQGQTSFNPVSGYTPGYADVYLNGVKLIDTNDYTATDGVTVVLNQGTALDDVVEVLAYVPRGLTDGYTKIEADARYATEAQGTLADSAVQPNDDVSFGTGDFSGNVGIGTNSPDSLLEIVGADPVLTIRDTETAGALTNATLRLAESGASDTLNNYWDINYAANGSLVFKSFDGASLSETMRIDSSGLEIGTSSGMTPTASLAINENVGGTPAIEIIPNSDDTDNETAIIRLWGTKFGTANRYSEIKNITNGSTASNELAFDTNGTERMRIDSGGNVGIGGVPNSWSTVTNVLQMKDQTSLAEHAGTGYFSQNWYYDGGEKYIGIGHAIRQSISSVDGTWRVANASNNASGAGAGLTWVERMRIDPSGYVTMPYQPAFWAWNSSISSSEGPVVFVSTDLNNGGHYNTSTGRFTAPVSGIYEFQAMTLFRKAGTGGSAEITLYINGSNVNGRGLVFGGAGTADDSHYPLSFTYRRYLNANDYVQLYIYDLSAAGSDMYLSSRLSWFSGRLIG